MEQLLIDWALFLSWMALAFYLVERDYRRATRKQGKR